MQTPYSDPRITVDYDGLEEPIDAVCEGNGAFAFYHQDHYHCDITPEDNSIPLGEVTFAIHLDDAIDPSTISADREHTVLIK